MIFEDNRGYSRIFNDILAYLRIFEDIRGHSRLSGPECRERESVCEGPEPPKHSTDLLNTSRTRCYTGAELYSPNEEGTERMMIIHG